MEKYLSKTHRIDELDSLRGIAALLVVFFHYTLFRPDDGLRFNVGTTGVDLFFIISGFVIYMSISQISNSKEFIVNRISRLYPTYWASVTLTFLLIICQSLYYDKFSVLIVNNYFGNMTMFQYYLNIIDLDGPYWTMIIEMNFYIIIVILYRFRLLKYMNIYGMLISISLIFLTHYWGYDEWLKRTFRVIPFLQFAPLFFAGILFYKLRLSIENKVKLYCMLVACLISQIVLFQYAGRSNSFIKQVEYAVILSSYFVLFSLFVENRLKFIISKPTLFLGKISFALYLTHQFISTSIIIPYFTKILNINFWLVSLLIALPINLGIAYVITFYIDIPGVKMLRNGLNQCFSKRDIN